MLPYKKVKVTLQFHQCFLPYVSLVCLHSQILATLTLSIMSQTSDHGQITWPFTTSALPSMQSEVTMTKGHGMCKDLSALPRTYQTLITVPIFIICIIFWHPGLGLAVSNKLLTCWANWHFIRKSVENVHRLGSKGIARLKEHKKMFYLIVPVSLCDFLP